MYAHGDPIAPWLNVPKRLDRITLLFVLGVTGLILLVVIVGGLKSVLKENRGGGIRLISFFSSAAYCT